MFGLSIPELLVIFIVILVLFGPEKLPVLASQFGRVMGELKRNSDALRREFYNSVYTPAQDFQNSLDRELKGVKNEITAPLQDKPQDHPPAAPKPPITQQEPGDE